MLIAFLSAAVLFLPSLSLGKSKQVDTALKYSYVREIKYNRSPEIDKWNKFVGNPLGASYCGALAGYSIQKCTAPKVKSGLAQHYYRKAPDSLRFSAGDVLRGKYKVKAGDLIIWARGSTIYGHIAIALYDWEGISGWTIEGNTSSGRGSQYDGDGVFIRWRTIYPYSYFRIIGFVRVIQ